MKIKRLFKKLFHKHKWIYAYVKNPFHKHEWIYAYAGTIETYKAGQAPLFRKCEICGKIEYTWKISES